MASQQSQQSDSASSAGEVDEATKAARKVVHKSGPEALADGQQWVGTEYSRASSGVERGACLGMALQLQGYLRNRWHCAAQPYSILSVVSPAGSPV